MGLDLTLLPFDHDSADLSFAHSMIACRRDDDLFEALFALGPAPEVPNGFSAYCSRCSRCHDHCYGTITETPYGDPLHCVRVDQLLEVPADLWRHSNLPALAYLHALDRAQRVALYWH